MGITVVQATDPELGPLMPWMLHVCTTTLARPLKVSRAARVMLGFKMKQQQSRAIPFNRLTFNS